MQDRVPKRDADVKGVNLAQDLRGEDEQQDDRLEQVGQFDIEGVLKEGRHQQKHKGEDAQHHVLVMADKRRAHKRDEHEGAQYEVQVKDHGLVLTFLTHGPLRTCEKSGHGHSDLRIYSLA